MHYYFVNKDELLIAVLKNISDRYTQSGQQMSASLRAEQLGEAGLNDALQRTLHHPETYCLRYELFVLGLRNPTVLPAVRSLLASGRLGISQVVHTAAGERSFDAETLASLLLACFDGLALQRLAEPDFEIESAYRLLSRMLNGLLKSE